MLLVLATIERGPDALAAWMREHGGDAAAVLAADNMGEGTRGRRERAARRRLALALVARVAELAPGAVACLRCAACREAPPARFWQRPAPSQAFGPKERAPCSPPKRWKA
jgi:hypothetical protein